MSQTFVLDRRTEHMLLLLNELVVDANFLRSADMYAEESQLCKSIAAIYQVATKKEELYETLKGFDRKMFRIFCSQCSNFLFVCFKS